MNCHWDVTGGAGCKVTTMCLNIDFDVISIIIFDTNCSIC